MKTTRKTAVVLGLLASFSSPHMAAPLGTAFNFTGKLNESGAPAGGSYDLVFTLYESASGGLAAGGPLTNSPVGVTNGLFTAALDFGSNIFNGEARWLAVGVRTHGGTVDFTTLWPRLQLAPTPYAIFAPTAGALKAGASPNFTGAVTFSPAAGPPFAVGNSNKVANLHADLLDGLNATAFWQLGGNAGTTPGTHFLGSTDNQAVELKVNGKRALRLEPQGDAPNTIAGAVNYADGGAFGVTISGGGDVNATNRVSGWFSTISGGKNNRVLQGADMAAVSGGEGNTVQTNADHAAIGGGLNNVVSADAEKAAITGGEGNLIGNNTDWAWIGGGRQNVLHGSSHSTLAGGEGNAITNTGHATIAGGLRNGIRNEAHNAAIGGGVDNLIFDPAWSATIAGGANNLIRNAKFGAISGGNLNTLQFGADASAISGGGNNVISNAAYSTISGGMNNAIQENAAWASIGGGEQNVVRPGGWHPHIGGGWRNMIESNAGEATIGGGKDNLIQTNAGGATIAGGVGNIIRPEAGYSSIGGGWDNKVQNLTAQGAIGGGFRNTIETNAHHATIAGGSGNVIGNNAYNAAIVGGEGNMIRADAAYATVLGGVGNVASGLYSVAAGRMARADHRGSFVWGDSENNLFPLGSSRENEFAVRAGGGFVLVSRRGLRVDPGNYGPLITAGADVFDATAPAYKQAVGRWGLFMEDWNTLVAGIPEDSAQGSAWFQVAKYATNGNRIALLTVDQAGTVTATAFNPTSDRNAKEHFTPVNQRAVLEKLVALPLAEWNFKADPATKHLGPVAQDFHAAFGLGTDDKHIATVDADGVALAAIQGLNQKMEAENAELKQEVAELRQLVNQFSARLNGGAK